MRDLVGWVMCLTVSLLVIRVASDFLYTQAEFKPTGMAHQVASDTLAGGD